ncbi:MAG: hypothetical protein HYR60_03010 [Acidobacteria bacterium]|nr:hypothetical protein [Acidobacteriota bacterium]MBI3474029.1 hypothetical protein [Candidatus Solibacter usitatus]
MMRADHATVAWDAPKKRWLVRIQIGGEVIKRPAPNAGRDADEQALREAAIQTAKDEGYELAPSGVTIAR